MLSHHLTVSALKTESTLVLRTDFIESTPIFNKKKGKIKEEKKGKRNILCMNMNYHCANNQGSTVKRREMKGYSRVTIGILIEKLVLGNICQFAFFLLYLPLKK